MSQNKISSGNATYVVQRKFDSKRTIQDALLESISLRLEPGQGKTPHMQAHIRIDSETSQADENML